MDKTMKRARVARRLTRRDFSAAKKIGDIETAHAQLGICKGTLYAWRRLKTWPKVLAHNAEIANQAKSKRDATASRTVTPKANVTIKADSFEKHLNKLSRSFTGLIKFLKENSVVVKN